MSAQAVNGAFAAKAAETEGDLDRPAVHGNHEAQAVTSSSNGHEESAFERYEKERQKRLRDVGSAQFVKLANSEKFKHLAADPWLHEDNNSRLELQNGLHTKVFIVGGGFGGLCYAIRMVQAGLKPEDIIIADVAGGYGGTWYWNRYPGLMCDVESYIYLPLLEETGYMPKHKYSYGAEIRNYANLLAKNWHLEDRGAFRQQISQLNWQESDKCWQIQTTDLETKQSLTITADFVCIAPGLLHQPRTSEFQGFETFKGHSFHTARWDYNYTGGSQEDPSTVKLKGKKVGIIGTGATAIQVVPNLARSAQELYVFQRTPSSVDVRGQRPTDPKEWSESIAAKKGWQTERAHNFNSFLNQVDPLPQQNLVDDGWTRIKSYPALLGGPRTITFENVADHVGKMHAWDAPRSEMIRNRTDEIVKDKDTADKLKPWYPAWCKRPCFHDDYLPSFNQPNVHLVDTDGKGIDRITEKGIIANNQEYELDCIILGTGYSLEAAVSPTRRAGIDTYGRNQKPLDDKWRDQPATLHGVLTHDFPNLFFSGPSQATASANFADVLDRLAQHCAYIVSQALKNSGSDRVVIEPSVEAEEEWSMRVMSGAISFAAVAGCTPGYLNGEGDADRMTQEQQMKSARMSMWSRGIADYTRVIEEWRSDGALRGLEVTAV